MNHSIELCENQATNKSIRVIHEPSSVSRGKLRFIVEDSSIMNIAPGRVNQLVAHLVPAFDILLDSYDNEFELCFCWSDEGEDFKSSIYMDGPQTNLLIPNILCRDMALKMNIGDLTFKAHADNWGQRKNILYWRGSTTGTWEGLPLENNLRVRTALGMLKCSFSDMKITRVVQYKDESQHAIWLQEIGILSNPVPFTEFAGYNYHPDIPGNVTAWGAIGRHVHGALVFRPEPSGQSGTYWHYLMKPYIHYIPVKSDFSNLSDQLQWAMENDRQAQIVSWRGSVLARSYLRRLDSTIFETLIEHI